MTPPSQHSLYQRLIGDAFARLDPVLQQFHSLRSRATAEGSVKIDGGQTALARMVARMAGMPRPAEAARVQLVVTGDERRERWERRFGDSLLVSHQWAKDGLLIESFGAMAIGFGLVVQEGGLRFGPRRMWLLGIPWRRVLGPQIEACTKPAAGGWHIDVQLRLPLIGRIVHYHGTIKPL